MKHLIFMVLTNLVGTVGPLLLRRPFLGVAIYYLYAVLRPQFVWEWSLPTGIAWSFYVAIATLLSVVAWKFGVIAPRDEDLGPPAQASFTFSHYAMLAFAGWICVTYFTAYSQEVAYPYFVEYLKIFIMYFVAALVVRKVSQAWTLYLMVAATLGYIAYETNYIYFFQGGYMFIFKRGWGGIDNNGAGLMIAMGIPMCLFAWQAIRRWYGWIFIALIPVMLHAVMMSYSRGAMLSLVVTIPLYIFRCRRRLQLGAILAAVAIAVPLLAGQEIRARFYSISDQEVDGSAQSRRTSWAIGWRMANEYPIFGMGIRNSNLFTYAYGADMEGRTIHSQYLQTAADSGLVALGLYLLVLGSAWLSARSARRAVSSRTDVEGTRIYAMSCGVQGAMAVFCFGALFLSLENFELPYILLLLVAQLPLLVSRSETLESASPLPAEDQDTEGSDPETDPSPQVASPCESASQRA
jgi:probable O-glycosylation ligase (exosortase A-associated)